MESNKFYMAWDPGKKGAYVIMDQRGNLIKKGGMPMIKKEYDLPAIFSIMEEVRNTGPTHIAIENPGVIFGASKSSVGSLQRCIGTLQGMLIAMKVPYTMSSPKTWQKEMWKDTIKVMKPSKSGKTKVVDTKATSIIAATRLFPGEDFKITNTGRESINYNDGMVDAALIAEYIRRTYEK